MIHLMNIMNTKKLIIILGPTASGKTELAIKIAKNKKTEIISCDSRQFFKEMSIGTAIPNQIQLKEVKHHFIHHISIDEEYNAGLFEYDALLTLKEIFKKNDFAVMVGGSGLYINAICNGIDNIPQVPKVIRQNLIDKYNINGLEWLQNQVIKVKPFGIFNLGSLEGMSKLQFILIFATKLGYSKDLINSIPFKKGDKVQANRPMSMIMNCNKIQNKLNINLPTLSEEIDKVIKSYIRG